MKNTTYNFGTKVLKLRKEEAQNKTKTSLRELVSDSYKPIRMAYVGHMILKKKYVLRINLKLMVQVKIKLVTFELLTQHSNQLN